MTPERPIAAASVAPPGLRVRLYAVRPRAGVSITPAARARRFAPPAPRAFRAAPPPPSRTCGAVSALAAHTCAAGDVARLAGCTAPTISAGAVMCRPTRPAVIVAA